MKTAHEQTLRQRIEALRDEVESISLDNHIYGDGEGIRASVAVARLTDALALPDGPEPLSAEEWKDIAHLVGIAALIWMSGVQYRDLAAKCRTHAESEMGR